MTDPLILLAEDNELNRDMLSRRLTRRGYRVETAIDGITAVEKARRLQPAMILLDLSLPGIDGWEVARRLKNDASTSRIPIIALTAHALVDDREKALAAGCNDYDTKPIDLARLLEKIRALLPVSREPSTAVL